jgi:2-succinyl-6-hydroxy-2,4-cyclohexadiene-1-carboxylate synthase
MKRVAINGVTYALREWGAGPPLVLLHGFTGAGALWAAHAEALAPRFRVVAPDLLGHGASGAPADPRRHAIEPAVADLAALLDGLGIERTALCGYSMGGRIALAFAVEHPERVIALAIEGASPGIADQAERAARAETDNAWAERLARDGLAAFVDAWMAQPLFASQAGLAEAARAAARAQRLANDPAGLAACLRGLGTGHQPSYWHRLHALPMPTLLLAGAHDAKFQAVGRAMQEGIPEATLRVVPGAGHTTHLENSAAFRQRLLAFLAPALGLDTAQSQPASAAR